MKVLKEYRLLIITLVILFILAIINYYNAIYTPFGNIDTSKISSYSMWFFTINSGIGSAIAFLSQVIIPFVCVYTFFQVIKTGFIQNIITKIPYSKYIKKAIKNSYLKAILLFPLFSLLVFILSSIIFPPEIQSTGYQIHYFPSHITNPPLHVFLSIISMALYSLAITNIALILSKYLKKFYLVLIVTLMVVFLIAFIEGNLVSNILSIFNQELFYNINIYDDYLCARGNYIVNISFGVLRNAILMIILYFTYKNPEKVVLKSDE